MYGYDRRFDDSDYRQLIIGPAVGIAVAVLLTVSKKKKILTLLPIAYVSYGKIEQDGLYSFLFLVIYIHTRIRILYGLTVTFFFRRWVVLYTGSTETVVGVAESL